MSAFAIQLQAQRTRTCTPQEGISLSYNLPSQFRTQKIVDAMRTSDGDALVELLLPLLTAWSGVTQEMLLGKGIGSAEPAPLDAARIAFEDRPGWVVNWSMHAVEQATEAAKKIQEAEGN